MGCQNLEECNKYIFRSNRQEVFHKKGVHKNFTKFAGKSLCQSLFFNKVAGLRPTKRFLMFSGGSKGDIGKERVNLNVYFPISLKNFEGLRHKLRK